MRANKLNNYIALFIGLIVFIGGVVFFVSETASNGNVIASILYMYSVSMLTFAVFLKIKSKKLFRIATISQLALGWLHIVLGCFSYLDGITILLGIGMTVLFGACFLYVLKRDKEGNKKDYDLEEVLEEEYPYWMEGV